MACSIGIAAAVGPAFAREIAPAVEQAGFTALWVNDIPGHDALEVLAAVAEVTETLGLATGVLPVDRRPGEQIVARVRALDLPVDRLTLGIGSGGLRRGGLDAVRTAITRLREGADARIVVGALGPRMRRLGATAGDGVLLSWLDPEIAAAQAMEAHHADEGAHAALYVRAALELDAVPRLEAERDAYAGYPAYAANFARLGLSPADTVITPETAAARVPAYLDAADEVVLRMIIADPADSDAAARFIDRAAELALS
ncbi:alkanesulfonate monooxygenase SsuD/methylene tetrahydromethanopterin reductase-like flavin-dependent oxidoreductase (luciferase family) [Microbacterium sp. AK009]|uniref:LLM class flavin-dependent oxidoreductase n=1 Tax=Microbacterium sp. AK009 TaxID=2723068 RepID=UPI0015CDCD16|nr:LLM class flavin-dependent oxidoreductase [Microbacterium sp. AK009]NYF17465.1 alkanesulfonate monooxygenase SsuD/methylene tetrahydromethanopterin reductase-like flavin-dependent oxidoreductase (luciferase family) [Microbacterium sp. AK009]